MGNRNMLLRGLHDMSVICQHAKAYVIYTWFFSNQHEIEHRSVICVQPLAVMLRADQHVLRNHFIACFPMSHNVRLTFCNPPTTTTTTGVVVLIPVVKFPTARPLQQHHEFFQVHYQSLHSSPSHIHIPYAKISPQCKGVPPSYRITVLTNKVSRERKGDTCIGTNSQLRQRLVDGFL